LVVLSQILKKIPCFGMVLKYLLAGLIMALALYFLSGWPLFILIILAGLVYFGFLYLIGGFSTKEVLSLIKKDV